jgi:hypothetical protein
MSNTSPDIIRQQCLDVALNGTESDGLALQRLLPRICQDWLTPAVEQELERFAPPDGHLYIDRLDVDAGMLMFHRLEYDLADRVRQSLEKAIQERLQPGDSLPAGSDVDVIDQKEMIYKTDLCVIYEAFIWFLTYGSLPWTYRLPSGMALEQVVTDLWQDTPGPDVEKAAFTEKIVRALELKTACKRLSRQFSTGFLEKLMVSISPASKREMDVAREKLRMSGIPQAVAKELEPFLWETAFKHVASGHAFPSKELIREVRGTMPMTTEQCAALTRILEEHGPAETDNAQTRSKIETKTLQTTLAGTESTVKVAPMPTRGAGPEVPPVDIGAPFLNRGDTQQALDGSAITEITAAALPNFSRTEATLITGGEHPDAQEGIYIENAGLVILHPFFSRFFEALDIARGDRLLEPERALGLLHFLVTGQILVPEYELVLPKILCNVALKAPVTYDPALTNKEKDEASALLQAVIRHWGALGNTSPDGLRGTYLIRPGKLSLRDNGEWLLQVESKSFDILLEELPWGIRMIKLPWMARLLSVQWRNGE